MQEVRERTVSALERQHGIKFIKKSKALFWDPDHVMRIACTISKRYSKQGAIKYWYAYHPQWHEFLLQGGNGFLVLGCTDLPIAFAVPTAVMADHLEELNATERKSGSGHYWHIKISEAANGGYSLQLPRVGRTLALDQFVVSLESGKT